MIYREFKVGADNYILDKYGSPEKVIKGMNIQRISKLKDELFTVYMKKIVQRVTDKDIAEEKRYVNKYIESYRWSMHNIKRNAIILAAGKSSRFAPFTYEKPKGLFVVRGQVLIERQIEQLIEADVSPIYIVVGYMKEKFFYLFFFYYSSIW